LPDAAAQLLDVVGLRLRARALRIEKLEARSGRALITFATGTPVSPDRLLGLLRTRPERLQLVRELILPAGLPATARRDVPAAPARPWREVQAALARLLEEVSG